MNGYPDFLIIPYQLIADENITPVDERVYAIVYWFTKLKNEKCTASNETLAKMCKSTAKAVQNSLTNLESLGYIKRKFRDESRRNRSEIIPLVTFSKVSSTSDSTSRLSSTGDTVSPTGDRQVSPTGDQSYKRVNKKRKEDNTADESADSSISSIIEVLDEFKKINPAVARMYGNKTQRKAVKDLIAGYGLDRVVAIVKDTLPKTNRMEYMPTIMTPLQLLEKYSSLEASIVKAKAKHQTKTPNVIIA